MLINDALYITFFTYAVPALITYLYWLYEKCLTILISGVRLGHTWVFLIVLLFLSSWRRLSTSFSSISNAWCCSSSCSWFERSCKWGISHTSTSCWEHCIITIPNFSWILACVPIDSYNLRLLSWVSFHFESREMTWGSILMFYLGSTIGDLLISVWLRK